MQEPQSGVEYPLRLGGSLLGKRGAGSAGPDEFCTLRYDFKPASVGRATQGQLDVQLASQKVSSGGGGGRRRQPACICASGPLPPFHAHRHPAPLPPGSHSHVCTEQAALQMGDAAFAGKFEPARGDGLDCVAVFDGTSFRLELLGATVKSLRWVMWAGGLARAVTEGAQAGLAACVA